MYERNSTTLDQNIKKRYPKQEEEKNLKKKLGFLSNTHQEFISNKKHGIDLHYLNNFQGFFNKNFNLTSFKQKQEDFRIKSQSPEKKINKHQIKGNGVPNDIIKRIKFLGNIFNSERFQKFFKSLLKLKTTNFEEISEKIQKFALKNSQLEGIMFSFYYIYRQIVVTVVLAQYHTNINFILWFHKHYASIFKFPQVICRRNAVFC